jgi:hypothetical protein
MFSAHRGESEGEGSDASASDEEVDATTMEMESSLHLTDEMDANPDASTTTDHMEDHNEAIQLMDAEAEYIKRRVQLDATKRGKPLRRGHRNASKLSVKGRLMHKDQW